MGHAAREHLPTCRVTADGLPRTREVQVVEDARLKCKSHHVARVKRQPQRVLAHSYDNMRKPEVSYLDLMQRCCTQLPIGRLSAEFLVIVIGVLVALAVDEFMTARAEAVRAAAYLEQVEVELTALAEDVEIEIESFASARLRMARLSDGIRSDPLAQTDSLDVWFSPPGFGPVRAGAGNAQHHGGFR
jgi:hypothetical protein